MVRLYPYWVKWVGVVLCLLSIIWFIGLLLDISVEIFLVDESLEISKRWATWLFLLGLFILMSTREKIEDDLVIANRYKSGLFAFHSMISVGIATALTSISGSFSEVDPFNLLATVVSIGSLIYLAAFYFRILSIKSEILAEEAAEKGTAGIKSTYYFLLAMLLVGSSLVIWFIIMTTA